MFYLTVYIVEFGLLCFQRMCFPVRNRMSNIVITLLPYMFRYKITESKHNIEKTAVDDLVAQQTKHVIHVCFELDSYGTDMIKRFCT